MTIHLSDLQQMPAESEQVSFVAGGTPEQHTFKGTRLFNVLNAAKVQFDPKVKNSQLRGYVLVTATDGYQSVVSWGELDPNFGNAAILLAWDQDGKPFSDKDGPRLTVPGDKFGGRYVSGVARIEVKDGANPGAVVSTAPVTSSAAVASTAASTSAGASGSASGGAVGAAGIPVIQGNLTVFAAASLTDAFNQMKSNIEGANSGAKVSINFAGSQILRTQLSQGAKADIFASADTANMDGATSDGTIDGKPSIFAHNKLVIVTPPTNPKVATVQDLGKPGIKVVIEQPSVPAGNYSRQALTKMSKDASFGADFSDKVLANVVSQETDVKAVLSRIQLGEADAGLLYVSDAATAQPGAVKTVGIPDQYNVIADYPIGVVKGAPNAAAARAFIQYLLSPTGGQAILQKNGLAPAAS